MKPTDEQQAAIDAGLSGGHLIVEAGAGSGKTTVLDMMSRAMLTATGGRGLYVAFNRATKDEALTRFDPAMQCATGHGLAYARFGKPLRHKLPSARPAQAAWEVARMLGIQDVVLDISGDPTPAVAPAAKIAHSARDAVDRFCRSADAELTRAHLGRDALPPGVNRAQYEQAVLAAAQAAWADLASVDGTLRMPHDVYRKLWALSQPNLRLDFFMLDEAQDTAPVLAQVLRAQDCQQIAVGDSCQQLYKWAGAVDAMANWGEAERLFLTQSWRFGPAIAEEANKWLTVLGSPLRLTGTEAIASELAELGSSARAVLCRTNVGAVGEVMTALEAGRRVALTGGGREIESLARAAEALQAGRRTTHPELSVFTSWEQVRQAANEENADPGLKVLVRMIDTYGPATVMATMRRLEAKESSADVVVSTGHKAKGREWPTVRASADFAPRDQNTAEDGRQGVDPEVAMLGYVTVTRAQQVLDRGPLAYVDGLTAIPVG